MITHFSEMHPSMTVLSSEAYGSVRLLQVPAQTKATPLSRELIHMWESDGLPEFATAVREHDRSLRQTQQGICHTVAFQFAWSFLATTRTPSTAWRWCMGDRKDGTHHSWIERHDEAFSVDAVIYDAADFEVCLVVQPVGSFRSSQRIASYEARSFRDVAGFIAGEFSVLFPKHRDLSDPFTETCRRLRQQELVGGRS